MNTIETETKIGKTVFTTPSDNEIVAIREVNAPRDLVWDHWTSPEHVPNWMTGPEGWTMPVCEIDLRPGGAWHFVWRRSDGNEMGMVGEYKEIAPPGRLVNTENWGGDWPETINTLVLTEKDGKTTMTCKVAYPSKEAREAATQTGMLEGWSQSYDRLDEYLRENHKSEIRNHWCPVKNKAEGDGSAF
ncbi:MAG TPA: SRPBCC family protein [Rhodothermales bacterium]|nr:SRPBCC family protein [Rhodothermales bacterium]